MKPITIHELTEAYRILDSIKKPDARVKAAKAKTFNSLLLMIEGMQDWTSIPTAPRSL